MKRRLLRAALVLALLAGAVILVLWLTRPDPVRVVVAPVARGRVEETVANTRAGTLEACRRARLAPPTGGTVVQLPVKAGDAVREGDLLLELWNRDLDAQARLALAEIASAGAREREACLLAEQARREAGRLAALGREGIAATDAVEQARAKADAQDAACQAARSAGEQARARLGVVGAERQRTVLRAPFDGIVADVTAELGEIVTPSPPGIPTPPAVDLIEQGCLYVTAPFDEVDAPRVRPGMTARITLDALPGRVFQGRVRRVAPFVLDREKQARTVDVEAELLDEREIAGLVPGYSADVEVLLSAREGVLRVPTEAIGENNRVLVLAEGRLVAREIGVGAANWQFTEVARGLVEGDRIVLSLDREGVAPGARAVAEER